MGLNVASSAGAGWLKKGEASAAVAQVDKADQERRKAEQGNMFRFWMNKGEECRITFVDGALSPEGYLLPPRYYEHGMMLNGKVANFVCPEKTLPESGDKCPICASGSNHASLVALFTVIDHREYKGQKGTYKDTPKLYVAKSTTFELLNKHAQKRGGLAGTTWDVMRMGDKSPQVGNQFDFVGKEENLDLLKAKYIREVLDPKTNQKTKTSIFVPANYEKEIVFRTGEQLAAMGLGNVVSTPSYGGGGYSNSAGQDNSGAGDQTDYSQQL